MNQEELKIFVFRHSRLIGLMFDEISDHIDNARISIKYLNSALKTLHGKDSIEIWKNLQRVVEDGAAIARILKPYPDRSRSKNAKDLSTNRGEAMRYLQDLNNDHPIFERKLRNRLVRLDEDIDDWWLNSAFHNMSRRSISDQDSPAIRGLQQHEVFEHFNFTTNTIIYLGVRYSILDIWESMREIKSKIYPARERMRDEFGVFDALR